MDRSSALSRLVTQATPAEIARMAAAVGQWLGALAPDKHSPGQQRHLEPAVSGGSKPGSLASTAFAEKLAGGDGHEPDL